MNRLFLFLALIAQSAAHLDLDKLHDLGINDCDLVPRSRYRLVDAAATHYFIGTDGSVTTDDVAHIFSLLHCSMPESEWAFVHTLSLIGDRSGELHKGVPPFYFLRSRIDNFQVSRSIETLRALCEFIYYTTHPRNPVIVLFMRPFDCEISQIPDASIRRVVFFQTGTQPSLTFTAALARVYTLSLDTPAYLATIHGAAYDIVSRVPPRVEAFNLSTVPDLNQELSASLISFLITVITLILSIIAYLITFCVTLVNASAVKQHYTQLADEWDQRRNVMLARNAVRVERVEMEALSVSTAHGVSFTALSISSTALSSVSTARVAAGEDIDETRWDPAPTVRDHTDWDPFCSSPSATAFSMNSAAEYYTPAASPRD